ncbi:MAG: hypothetical protein UHP27_03790 [Muribaculaceae bacterium]|nr:hypothetical protein [Muribaculaceae bacterium]
MTKKLFPIMAVAAALLSGCSSSDKSQDTDPEAVANASRQELEQAISDRDQLLTLMNEIQSGLDDIKNLENIVSVDKSETPDQRAQAKRDIEAIKAGLIERQAKLDELEKKLSASNLYSDNLKKTIQGLKDQIAKQEQEIARLTGELETAHTRITQLGTQVDSLNTTVTNVSSERDAAELKSQEIANELNVCYYAVGSSKELKEHKILEKGFLRKTKLMKGDFDQSFFNKGDKRTLSSIPLHAKKAKVLSNQPAGSYTLTEKNGQAVLTITNPDKFWSLSNYLVIQLD